MISPCLQTRTTVAPAKTARPARVRAPGMRRWARGPAGTAADLGPIPLPGCRVTACSTGGGPHPQHSPRLLPGQRDHDGQGSPTSATVVQSSPATWSPTASRGPPPTVAAVLARAGTAQLLDAATRRGWISAGTAGAARAAAVPVLVLGALVWLAVTVLRAGGSGPPPAYAEFVDPSSSSFLDVQLDRSSNIYGSFSAVVPGEGRVWPANRVDAGQRDGAVVELRYRGAGYREVPPPGGAPAVPGARSLPPEKVQLRVVGHVDPERHVASVDVVVNGAGHHIGSPGEVGGANIGANDFLRALTSRNWAELYRIETASMRTRVPRSYFLTALSYGGAVTCISRAEAISPTTVRTSPAGISYARTPVRITYGGCAGGTSLQATLVLVVDGGVWKALSLE